MWADAFDVLNGRVKFKCFAGGRTKFHWSRTLPHNLVWINLGPPPKRWQNFGMTSATGSATETHIRIRIQSLHPERPPTFDIFVLINQKHVLYLRAGDKLDPVKLEKLKISNSDVFFIEEKDRQNFKNYVHDQVNDPSLPSVERALLLRESSYTLVEELFENPDVNKALDGSKGVIDDFVQFMKEPEAMANLIGLSSHDFYTYNHSLDVAVYALGLAKAAGYSRNEDLVNLGRGALFHDLGKRHVPAEIITKKGGLDDQEWAVMKKHPLFGLQVLNDYPDSNEEIKACCFEHHENHMGNGYPQQLQGDEIHPMARIVALTDTFDALTTKRSYNNPMNPADALTLMKDKLAGRFDPDLMNAMYSVLFQLSSTIK